MLSSIHILRCTKEDFARMFFKIHFENVRNVGPHIIFEVFSLFEWMYHEILLDKFTPVNLECVNCFSGGSSLRRAGGGQVE